MMIEVLIEFLIDYLAELKAESLPSQISHLMAIPAALLGLAGFVRYRARRRYRKDIEETADLRNQLAAVKETARALRNERDELQAEVEKLEEASSKGFLAQMNIEQRDGNFERQIALSESFLNHRREPLHRAFATLAHAAIGHAVEDGAVGYENALSYARAGLAVNRDDEILRALVEDLQAAASATALGLRAKPHDDATRAARVEAREALPRDLEAITKNFYAARTRGWYALMAEFAEHGQRLAKRLTGQGSRISLFF